MICPKCDKYYADDYKRCPHCLRSSSHSNPWPSSPQIDSQPAKRCCPTCGSDRVVRFSRGVKVTKVATLGVFGLGNVHKIFKCKNCGYKW